MSERYTHLDSIKVDGIATTSQQGALIGASKVMPQPSADLDGVTIQYMGPTDSNYTFKRMYTCTTVGSEYKWVDATPVDIVQNSNGLFIGGNEVEVADSTTYGVMSPDQAEKVESSFVKLETVTEGAEPNKVDIIRVEGTPLQVSGSDKSVNITRTSLGLGDSAQLDVGTLEGQIPVLGANGQLPESTIPPFATGTFINSVRTKALLTSLSTAKLGDWAKVTSDDDFNNNGLYILNGTAYGVLSNWVQMVGPANVESVNGKSGRVVLDKEDIGLANVDNTSDAKKPISEAMQSALNLKANDTKVVHNTGSESISGAKTFTANPTVTNALPRIAIKNTVDNKTDPSNNTDSECGIYIAGSDGQTYGKFVAYLNKENVARTRMISSTSNSYSILELYRAEDGTSYATAPSWKPGTVDNTDRILTTKMANSLPSLVHTTGSEEISGTKIFKSSPRIASDWLWFVDSNNANLGGVCCGKNSDSGLSQTYIRAYNTLEDGTSINSSVNAICLKDGTIYGTAPATKDAHPTNAIVTKGYLKSTIEQASLSKQPYVVAFDPAVAVTNATTCIKYQGHCASYTKPVMSNNVLNRGSWTDDEYLLKRMQYCTFRPDGTIKEVLYKNDLTKVWIKNYADETPDTPIYANGELMEFCATQTQPSEIPSDAIESSITTLDTMLVIPTLYTYGDERGFKVSYDPSQGSAEAHTLDGHVYKYEAIGVYLASNSSDGTTIMSVSGAEPVRSMNRYLFRNKLVTKDQTNGKWKLFNYYDSRMFKLLAYLIGGSLNSQATFGAGVSTGSMGAHTSDVTDNWTRNYAVYTGKTNTVGMLGQSTAFTQKFDADAYGVYDNGNTTQVRQVKFLIEAPWGQDWQYMDDSCNVPSTGRFYAGTNSASVIQQTDTGGGAFFTAQVANPTLMKPIFTFYDPTDGLPGLATDATGQYSSMLRTENEAWGMPVNLTGNSSTGTCDGWWMPNRTKEGVYSSIVGGDAHLKTGCGVSAWNGASNLNTSSANFGARACFLFD